MNHSHNLRGEPVLEVFSDRSLPPSTPLPSPYIIIVHNRAVKAEGPASSALRLRSKPGNINGMLSRWKVTPVDVVPKVHDLSGIVPVAIAPVVLVPVAIAPVAIIQVSITPVAITQMAIVPVAIVQLALSQFALSQWPSPQ